MPKITELDNLVDRLPDDTKDIFNNLLFKKTDKGKRMVPPAFYERFWRYFREGDETREQTIERASEQTVVRTFNRYTLQGALFNELRTSKPGSRVDEREKYRKDVIAGVHKAHEDKEYGDNCEKDEGCDFCHPEKYTTKDSEERIEKNGHVTAINAAGYNSNNGMIIFRNWNPLKFTLQNFSDWIGLASEWFKKKRAEDVALEYPFLMWNCLEKSGASQIHGHMHMLIESGMAYDDVERLRDASERYRQGGRNFFKDLSRVHKELGLGFEYNGADVFASLTPKKDKETLVVSNTLEGLVEPLFKVLRCFIDKMDVFAFNMVVQMPALTEKKGWQDFPYIGRVVDRGNPLKIGSDFAGMEIYGTPVIGSDSYRVVEELIRYMKKNA